MFYIYWHGYIYMETKSWHVFAFVFLNLPLFHWYHCVKICTCCSDIGLWNVDMWLFAGTAKLRPERESEVYRGANETTESPGFGAGIRDIPLAIKVLVTNPTFMFLNMAGASEGMTILDIWLWIMVAIDILFLAYLWLW